MNALVSSIGFKRLERLVYIVVAYNYMHRQLPRVGVKTVQIRYCQTFKAASNMKNDRNQKQNVTAGQAKA